LKFFPDMAPKEPTANLKAMRVRDLLTMSSGHETEPKYAKDVPWVQTALAQPVPRTPGSHFFYDGSDTYLCSAIVQKVTGQTVRDYLQPRLFEPLGIAKPEWKSSPQGINVGGSGLYLRTEDIAKFGQLYLQRGMWKGKQLVPAAWVDLATSKQVANDQSPAGKRSIDWSQGYGFQFWRCTHGAYRGDGKDGQFCIVLPDQDAVVAITADTRDMQAELKVVWDHLLPAFAAKKLPENRSEQEKLRKTLSQLAVRTGDGS
jgi:CubicO group peptidase (beta-lactamase class C family)